MHQHMSIPKGWDELGKSARILQSIIPTKHSTYKQVNVPGGNVWDGA